MISKRLTMPCLGSDFAILFCLALVTIIAHILTSNNYGYFLDEFYTLACSKNLGIGFVDIPPVAPTLLALNTAVWGDSLWALRLLPSVFSGLIVVVTGLMVKRLGGNRFAMTLAAVSAVFVPIWMAICSVYTYDFLDQFMIVLLFYTVICYLTSGNLKLWPVIGLLIGLGVLTKPSMIFFGGALVIATLMTSERRHWLTPWPWLSGIIALLIILPALVWQIDNHFPIAEYWKSYSLHKTVNASWLEYLIMQIISVNFCLLPLWLMGLGYFLFDQSGKKFRVLGLTYLLLLILFLVLKSNVHMLTPAYAMLLAGGAVTLEKVFVAKGWKQRRFICVAFIIVTGGFQALHYMPILPVEQLIQYLHIAGSFTGAKSLKTANEDVKKIPSFFYNRMEWDTFVKDVAEVYQNLPARQQTDVAIISQNYGYAGAIDFLGGEWGLPKTVCGQLNYYFFSLDNLVGKNTFIIIGESREDLAKVFGEVKLAKISRSKYRLPYEVPIYLCRELKATMDEVRKGIKRFQ